MLGLVLYCWGWGEKTGWVLYEAGGQDDIPWIVLWQRDVADKTKEQTQMMAYILHKDLGLKVQSVSINKKKHTKVKID